MTINQIRYFAAIAREKNMTRAAEKLYISQQALSKAIHQLEEEWNGKLLTRTESGVELTYLGQQLLPVVESLLDQYDKHLSVINTIIGHNDYLITIVYENEMLLQLIPYDFLTNIGDIRITTRRVRDIDQCIDMVKKGKADIALVNNPPPEKKLLYRSILRRKPTVIIPKAYPLAKKDHIVITDLKEEPHIWVTSGASYTNQYVKECIQNGFYPKFIQEYPTSRMALQAVSTGRGITLGVNLESLPDEEKTIVRKPLESGDFAFDAGFLLRGEEVNKPELQSFFRAIDASLA